MHLKITAMAQDIVATPREKLVWKYSLLTIMLK
jgi:hypothetical protein